MKRFIALLSLAAVFAVSVAAQDANFIKVEAESFTREEGGRVVKTPGRPGASGDTLTTWNYEGHILEWQVEVPADGDYQLTMHVAAGRDGTVYREIKFNGEVPSPAFAKLAVDPTGGFGKTIESWKVVAVMDGDQPATVSLKKGVNVVTMTNLGGDGLDGAMNVDFFVLSLKGTDLAELPGTFIKKEVINPGTIPAFPGAEGFGKYTIGGRGGQVLTVSNLNDSGPGSLREAVMTKGPRTVVFGVSGNIELKSQITVVEPYLTIAGQTAPRGGITLKDECMVIATHHVIVRYIRVRPGDTSGRDIDSIGVDNANYVILDHVSTSWSIDETLSVSESDNVTVQWCMITESLTNSIHAKGSHGYGSLIRGFGGQKVAYYNNLYAHHKTRMPRPGNYKSINDDPVGLMFDFRNNVLYNFSSDYIGYNADRDAVSSYNFINNFYRPGPGSGSRNTIFNESSPYTRAYFEGNSFNGKVPADPWSLVTGVRTGANFIQPKAMFDVDYPTVDAKTAYNRVIKSVGASKDRDAVDKRIINEVFWRTGRTIDSQNDVGGWPVIPSVTGPADSDKDGMPDAWETRNGLNPNDASDANRVKPGQIYTNLELYLNSLI